MTNSDKHNIFFAHAQLQNSVTKELNTIRNITQTSKETHCRSFDKSLAACLENVKKSLVNTFRPILSHKI